MIQGASCLLFAITPSYVPQFCMAMGSILDHASAPLHVVVLAEPGTAAAFGKPPFFSTGRRIEAAGGRLEIHELDVLGRLSFQWRGSYHHSVFLRLFFDDFLPPEIARALYLDVDILVRQDLLPLLGLDLEGAIVGAVEDHGVSRNPALFLRFAPHYQFLGIPHREGAYFNSGVMLIDRAAWRDARVTERVMAFCALHTQRLPYADQDALNAVLAGRWKKLPPRWNAQRNLFEDFYTSKSRHPFAGRARFGAPQEPAILHYTGFAKPWLPDQWHPRDRFWGWMDEYVTAWLTMRQEAGEEVSGDSRRLRLCRFAHRSRWHYWLVAALGKCWKPARFSRVRR